MKKYKYQKLHDYFSVQSHNLIRITYKELEEIAGFKLPDSAYTYEAYWNSSETHTICRSWDENNYKKEKVVLGEYVEFKRVEQDCKNNSYKIEINLPIEFIGEIIRETTKLGACKIGQYDHVATYYEVEGCWRPLDKSNPVTGDKGEVNYGKEYKLEIRCEEDYIRNVLRKIREIHPYEEVLINVVKLYNNEFE